MLTIIVETRPSGDQDDSEREEQVIGDILDDDFGEEGEYCPEKSAFRKLRECTR